jgi:hypothetical protein
MKMITIDQARQHCKADGDDDGVLEIYADAAESLCAQLANRNLYKTAAELLAAIAGVPTAMTTAYANYDAAVVIANASDDDRIRTMMLANAQLALNNATISAERTLHGITAEDFPDIISAVLMTTGHFYRTRENVVSGQGAAAIEVPMSAREVMTNLRWPGTQLP